MKLPYKLEMLGGELGISVKRLHIDTLEAVLLWCQLGFASAIFAFGSRLPAPPPWFDRLIVILPPSWWSLLYIGFTVLQIKSRIKSNDCLRLRASLFALGTSGFLCGPLYLKAPGLSFMMLFLVVPQALLCAKLKKQCTENETLERITLQLIPGTNLVDRRKVPRL